MQRSELEPLLTAGFEVSPARSLGSTPIGERRIVQITGGSLEGPKPRGTILPEGAGWWSISTCRGALVRCAAPAPSLTPA